MDFKEESGGTVINGIKLSSITPQQLTLDEPDAGKTILVTANDGKTGQTIQLSYSNIKVVGNGSFGVVFQAKLNPDGESAAVKKVLQDKRFKVRFLEDNTLRTGSYKSCVWFPIQTSSPSNLTFILMVRRRMRCF